MAADDAARRSGPAAAALNPLSRVAVEAAAQCRIRVIFDGFSGDCRLADVRFYPHKRPTGDCPEALRPASPTVIQASELGSRIMRYELADYEWASIKPMLPNKPRGVPRVNDRRVLKSIFWVLRSAAPWRDLPEAFGPYATCYNRFVRWRRAGAWGRIIDVLAAAHDAAVQMIDISIVRVHQQGACITRNRRQSMGRSRGGWTSKFMRWSMAMACLYGWR
jgi:transposase